jgi:hypothetical protein
MQPEANGCGSDYSIAVPKDLEYVLPLDFL